MQNLQFDDGYKRYTINGDSNKVIVINPSDFSIIERINDAYKMIEEAANNSEDVELKTDGSPADGLERAAELQKSFDNSVRNAIDHIFNSEVSAMAFGKQSPLSLVGGIPLYERFLNSVIPVIKKEIESEMQASRKRVNKYTKQVK